MKRMIVFVLMTAALCQAGVIRVPSQQPTIQAGLDAAGTGDTVLVATGTYPERITWPARDGIVLASEQGAESTVIDAGRAGRVITMNAMLYTSATVVRGFRIANGQQSGSAAGVYCTGAPVFLQNQIVDNLSLQATTGGGVYADGAPVFAFNLIARDSLRVEDTAGFRYGGGVYCTSSGVFYQNVFADNAVTDSSCSGFRYGGALYLAGGSPLVFCNLFLRNAARMKDGSGFAYGGGICAENTIAAYIANNTFVGNVCAAHVTYGGAVYATIGAAVVKNNIAIFDSCLGSGGGGGFGGDSIDIVHDYNNVWQNYPNDYYRCVAGPHALSADPLFVTAPFGEYCLSQVAAGQADDSPCLDAGDTLLMAAPLNLDSLIRLWTTRTDSVVDAGAIDLGFHYAPAPPTGVQHPAGSRRHEPGLRLRPNPARGAQVRLTGQVGASVAVFDAAGRLVIRQALSCTDTGATLDISQLRRGVYVVRSEGRGRPMRGQLLVRR